jgi:outer membrane lipoprotein-sorting protein
MKSIKYIICSVILSLMFTTHASATSTKQVITEVKQYLKTLNSTAADFVQIDPNGAKFEGKLLILKPNKFRCNYYPPYPLLITGGENYITIYDYEMSQISRVAAKDNLLSYLLAGDENIEKHFHIIDAYEQDGKLLLILVTKEDERKVHVEIDKKLNKLNKIELVDLNDNITSIYFTKIINVAHFNKDLFIIKNPDMFGAPEHLTKAQIEKRYR